MDWQSWLTIALVAAAGIYLARGAMRYWRKPSGGGGCGGNCGCDGKRKA